MVVQVPGSHTQHSRWGVVSSKEICIKTYRVTSDALGNVLIHVVQLGKARDPVLLVKM